MELDAMREMDYSGERYDATAPDTLNLADRARLALNGLGGTIDTDCHHTMFFNVHYCHKPPYMRHQGSADVTCDPKFAESFPMMRLICGSDLHQDVEEAHRAELLSRLSHDDGLYYNIAHADRPWRGGYNPAFDGGTTAEDLANVGGCGRMLRAMVTWREMIGPDPILDRRLRALVRGLARIAVYRNDYAYYPNGGVGEPFSYLRQSGWLRTDEPQSEAEGGEGSILGYQGHQIQGLMRWYVLSGDCDALDLAAKLSRFCALPKFWGGVLDLEGDASGLVGHVAAGNPDPPGIPGAEQGHWYTHFHARAIALRGILEYARVVQDARLLEFIRCAYEFTLSMGIPRLGWVNCWPGRHAAVEGCALGDLVALGIRLSDAGVGDYWDDVDAVTRNQLVEGQLVGADLLEQISEASAARTPDSQAYPKQENTEKVITRSVGNFAGMSTPADILQPWVMQCCTGNGTQGLYYAWEGIVRSEGDTAQVNLLLNRASPWLDVDSWLPYEGKAVLNIKSARRVAVRIPCWVGRRELRSLVNETPRDGIRVGNYLLFTDLNRGDRVALHFPVPESRTSYTIAAQIPGHEKVYTLSLRGSTVVEVSPHEDSPTTYPLYQRDHMKAKEAPVRQDARFVAHRSIVGW